MVNMENTSNVEVDELTAKLSRRQFAVGVLGALGLAARPRILDALEARNYDVSPREKVKSTVDMDVIEIPTEIDLIRHERMGWDEVPGVSVERDGLRLNGFNPTIIDKGTITLDLQDNPPVNMNLLRTNGGFSVTAGVDSYGPVHIQLYGESHIRQDDVRYEFERLDCELGYDTLTVREWFDDGQGPIALEFPLTQPGYSREIRIQYSGDDVQFYNGADFIGHMPANKIFDDGNIWFGLNNQQGTALVHKLTFQELEPDQLTGLWNASAMRVRREQGPTIQGYIDAAGRDLAHGTAASVQALYTNELEASLVLGGNYRTIGPDNGLKWQDWDLGEGEQDARYALSGLRLIKAHGFRGHGHTAYYKKSNPKDFEAMPTDTKDERMRVMQRAVDHVVRFGETFGKYIDTCDVTGEIMDGWYFGARMEQNAVYRAMGMQGIALLYRTADEVMPDVKLGANEFSFEIDPMRTRLMVRIAEQIRAFGGRIDYVGSETHIYHESGFIIDRAMRYFLRKMRETGLEVHFSEIDVTDEAGIVAQMRQYRKLYNYAYHDENVKRVATWGPSNRYGSKAGRNRITGKYDPNTGLPVDKDFHRSLITEVLLEDARRFAGQN